MGQHRAERTPVRRRGSDTPKYVGKRVAGRAVDTPGTHGSPVANRAPASAVDVLERVLPEPAIESAPPAHFWADLDGRVTTAEIAAIVEPYDETTYFTQDPTEALPLLAAQPPGRRRATRSAAPTPLLRTRPSTPLVAGLAALALAAGGAVMTAQADPHGWSQAKFAQSSALTGTSGAATYGHGRDQVVSRSEVDRVDPAALATIAAKHDAAVDNLNVKASARSADLFHNRWILPVSGYHLTARFGEYSSLWSTMHTGLDFAAPSGTPIYAITRGTITSAGYDGAYGNKTVLTLADGTQLWFCHQSSTAVNVGDSVAAGDLIGYVGSTGNTTGPHLHLEVHPGGGDAVDPFSALVQHGLQP